MNNNRGIHTVLIGTSLTAASDEVVRSGLQLARAAGARVHLTHAFVPPMVYGTAPFVLEMPVDDLLRAERIAIQQRMEEQVERLGIELAELAGTSFDIGPAHRLLIETAHAIDADLIVVGAVESAPRLAKIFGSTADRVLRKSTRPVLVVRSELALPPARVLLPVDLSPLAADAFRRGLDLLARITPNRVATLEALFVLAGAARQGDGWKPDEAAAKEAALRLEAFIAGPAAETGWKVTGHLAAGYVDRAILDRAEQVQPDLLVLGTHGGGGFERFLIGSVAASVIRHGRYNVLVIPPMAAQREEVAHGAQEHARA